MKKRFTKKAIRQYLLSKIPENFSPKKTLGRSEKRYLSKFHSLIGHRGYERKRILSSIIAKEMARVTRIRACNQQKGWSNINTLEQGLLTNNPIRFYDRSLKINHKSPIVTTPTNIDSSFHQQSSPNRKVLTVHNNQSGRQSQKHHERKPKTEYLTSVLQMIGGMTKRDRSRSSPLLKQILETRKIRILYGNLRNREIKTLAQIATTMRGEKSQNIFKLLESRLDVVLYRGNLFSSIIIAQQWIRNGFITVNGRVETIAAKMLTPGDVVKPIPSLLPAILANLKVNWNHSGRLVDLTYKKSVHIEVSYRSLTIVYLCHAQNVILPTTLDMAEIQRSLAK
jgi:ribosomal protein S4